VWSLGTCAGVRWLEVCKESVEGKFLNIEIVRSLFARLNVLLKSDFAGLTMS
jgi:hypothetical protein